MGDAFAIFLIGVAWGLMLPLIGEVNRNRAERFKRVRVRSR
jgi:hypothetical protein